MDTLKELLPHGSGIDYEWEISNVTADSVIAKNGWHYLSQNGYYLGCIDFQIEIGTDGAIEYPEMPDVEEFAKTQLAKDITVSVLEKDDVTEDEILETIMTEFELLKDCIFHTFLLITPDDLGKAVKDYIKEECELSIDLPGFWGFYCSPYVENSDMEYLFFNDYDSLNDKTKELYREFVDRKMDYSFDSDFIETVCKRYVASFDDAIRNIIPAWNTSEFELVQMPKYYNFSSDRCFAKCLITDDVVEQIQKYLDDNKEKWESYIKRRFTSYDGYFSNYSNNINDWQMPIRNMDYNELGAVLQFILRNEDEDSENQININTIEELSGHGEDYDFYITNKNQAALNEYIKENGGCIED